MQIKLSALNQHKKGHTLYDLYKSLNSDIIISRDKNIHSYASYMINEETGIPYLQKGSRLLKKNLIGKM